MSSYQGPRQRCICAILAHGRRTQSMQRRCRNVQYEASDCDIPWVLSWYVTRVTKMDTDKYRLTHTNSRKANIHVTPTCHNKPRVYWPFTQYQETVQPVPAHPWPRSWDMQTGCGSAMDFMTFRRLTDGC